MILSFRFNLELQCKGDATTTKAKTWKKSKSSSPSGPNSEDSGKIPILGAPTNAILNDSDTNYSRRKI